MPRSEPRSSGPRQDDDPLAPPRGVFAEPWHAQTLAMAQALVSAGHATPADWAEALGAALARAAEAGRPDTEETYFLAALEAVEGLAVARTDLTPDALAARRDAWAAAYRRTPHGQPVVLAPEDAAPRATRP